MKHFLGIKDCSEVELSELLNNAQLFVEKQQSDNASLKHRFVANLFFENSTRTRFSFEVAGRRLGAQVLNFHEAVSSTNKGESFLDTLKTIEAMGVETAIIRHEQNGILEAVQDHVQLSMINAGTGNEEHPTQGLLDLLTIKQEFQNLEGLTVAIIGDIEHSRVARSTCFGLVTLGANVIFSGPECFRPQDTDLVQTSTWLSVPEAIRQADVVMMLRVQGERHSNDINVTTADYLQQYGLTKEREKLMKSHAIIMHPAPVNRGVEIDASLVESPRSRIFKQVQNGVGVRMAVLEKIMLPQKDRNGSSSSIVF